jgi:hypothetical protein
MVRRNYYAFVNNTMVVLAMMTGVLVALGTWNIWLGLACITTLWFIEQCAMDICNQISEGQHVHLTDEGDSR